MVGKWENRLCPICGKESAQPYRTGRDQLHGLPGEFHAVYCTACDFAYLNPRPSEEALAAFYSQDYYSYEDQVLPSVTDLNRPLQKAYLQSLGYYPELPKSLQSNIAQLLALFWPGIFGIAFRPVPRAKTLGKILDVGCGSAFYLKQMKKLGWEVWGTEMDAAICDRLNREKEVRMICGSLKNHNLPENSFDVITLWESLEHLLDPLETLSVCKKLLKPGGVLMGVVPNRESFYAKWFKESYLHLDLPRHLSHFSEKSLQKIILKSGFSKMNIRHISYGGNTLLLSSEMKKNKKENKSKIDPDFWQKNAKYLKGLNIALTPIHKLMDLLHGGIQLEFQAAA